MVFFFGCSETYESPRVSRNYRIPRNPYESYTNKARAEKTYSNWNASAPLKGKVIVVDPGHGGHDPGAGEVGYSNIDEKVINLDIAQKLGSKLAQKGARVIMTRNTDIFIELDDRASLADRANADLLVSIHADSFPNSSRYGTSLYIADNATWKSRKTARSIQKSFSKSQITCLGIRSANYRVLVKHSKPSVLVECGYLTNYNDAKRLSNPWYRTKVASAIAEGIEDSFAPSYFRAAK
jgi:N-acetylmuramoyl-L-alanine amidase